MIDLRIMRGQRPMLCGHRGGLRTAPENTLAALRQCHSRGGGAAEIDIRLTSDGALVLMHDARLERTTNGAGLVEEQTLAEIQTVDAGAAFGGAWAGEPVPTLAEAIRLAADIGLILRVELKTYRRDQDVFDALAEVLEGFGDEPPVVLCSFDHVQLAASRRRFSQLATMGLFQVRSQAVGAVIMESDLQGISVMPDWFDEAMAEAAHAAGAAVSCAFPLPRNAANLDTEEARRVERIQSWCDRGVIDMVTTDDLAQTQTLLTW